MKSPTIEVAKPKAPSVSPEEAEAAAQAAEMMHNLRIVEHMSGEALTLLCLRNEASAAADKAATADRIVRPSASAASKLLGANGKAALTGTDVQGDVPMDSVKLRAAADQYDHKAKACLQNLLAHTQRVCRSLGYEMTMTPLAAKGG